MLFRLPTHVIVAISLTHLFILIMIGSLQLIDSNAFERRRSYVSLTFTIVSYAIMGLSIHLAQVCVGRIFELCTKFLQIIFIIFNWCNSVIQLRIIAMSIPGMRMSFLYRIADLYSMSRAYVYDNGTDWHIVFDSSLIDSSYNIHSFMHTVDFVAFMSCGFIRTTIVALVQCRHSIDIVDWFQHHLAIHIADICRMDG